MVNTLTKYVNRVFVQLQSNDLLICQQKIVLENLAVNICAHMHVEGPHPTDSDTIVVIQNPNLIFGRFSISHDSIVEVIYDQGLFIRGIYNGLNDIEQDRIISAVGKLILSIIDGVIAIQAERDSNNTPSADLPPVLPHELVKLWTGEFGINVLA